MGNVVLGFVLNEVKDFINKEGNVFPKNTNKGFYKRYINKNKNSVSVKYSIMDHDVILKVIDFVKNSEYGNVITCKDLYSEVTFLVRG